MAIHDPRGHLVAVIEIVSPGNKGSRAKFQDFVDKAVLFLRQGVNVLVIDLLPPTQRDPEGIHKAIWDEVADKPFELPPDKRRRGSPVVIPKNRSAACKILAASGVFFRHKERRARRSEESATRGKDA